MNYDVIIIGAGAFSDGKYNITNDFVGTLYEYIGKKQALDLMHDPGLYIIGDGSGITHSLSHASASGVHVARNIAK